MVGVGEGQRLDAGKRGRQREFAQVGIVVHFDVQGVFQADRRENREPIVPKIAGIITKTNRIKSQSNYQSSNKNLHVLNFAQRQKSVGMNRFNGVFRHIPF